jgi:hypothetical protein
MSRQELLELFVRADRVHQHALEEIAVSKRLMAESQALLECVHEGLSDFSRIEARQRDPRRKHP